VATDIQVIIQDNSSHVTVEDDVINVVTIHDDQQVVVEDTSVQVVFVGEQGPQGPQGNIGPAGGVALTVTAGAALGGHRIVHLDSSEKAQYAGNQTAAHALVMLGMTLGAAVLNDPVNVQSFGEVIEPSWSWTLNQPVYLDTNGLLTQTTPVAPALFQRIVGFPTAATKLFLSFREPIFI